MKAMAAICAIGMAALLTDACASGARLPGTGEVRSDRLSPELRIFAEDAARTSVETMRKNRIPGLSIALVDEQGTLWENGFGFADDARRIPVTPQTRFSVQSMSKTFTGISVLAAVNDGLLDLDASISRYLPDFRVNSIFEDHPLDRITLRHLLTHTAGFTHEAPAGNNFTPPEPSFDEHVASIQDTWLKFRVGERESYSNLGIDLAAYIVQKARGRPFVEVMRDTVLTPPGMDRTTDDGQIILSDALRATGHRFGFPRVRVICPMLGAGGIWSTAHDLGTFVTFMLREGKGGGLLPPSAFLQLRTTANGGGYGLGVAYGRLRNGDLYLNHGGGGFGFLTYMAWYPTLGIGVAVLTNSADHPAAHVALADKLVATMVDRGLVTSKFSLRSEPVSGTDIRGHKDNSAYFSAHADKTLWKNEWSRYLGKYTLSVDSDPAWYARLTLAVGYPRSSYVQIARQAKGIALDGSPMVEAEPGLFFTLDGEAMDFRGATPTWRNIPVTRR